MLTTKTDPVLSEAKKLYDLGFSVLWTWGKNARGKEGCHPKAPSMGKGWQHRCEDWQTLEKTYQKGFGIGVRCGAKGEMWNGLYLAMIDLDLKSKNPSDRKAALEKFREIFGTLEDETVSLESPNGMRFLVATHKPVKSKSLASGQWTKVFLPGSKISEDQNYAVQKGWLTQEELHGGYRMRPAWEIDLLGTGKQGILPPSWHPDSGMSYEWIRSIHDYDIQTLSNEFLDGLEIEENGGDESPAENEFKKFTAVPFELLNTNLDPSWSEMIETGEGINQYSEDDEGIFTDQATGKTRIDFSPSRKLQAATIALVRAGFSDDEITSIFTDKSLFMGRIAYKHTRSNNRSRAAHWFSRYTLRKAHERVNEDSQAFEGLEEQTASSLSVEDTAQQKNNLKKTNWKKYLKRKAPPKDAPDGTLGAIMPTLRNIVIILENAVGPDIFVRDLFRVRDSYGIKPPWSNGKIGDAITDDDTVHILDWLGQHWDFEPSKEKVECAIIKIASKNSFHPVRDWFDTLEEWDGVDRLNSWLKENYGAEEREDYLADLFRKWMVAAVTRIYEPGTKFDHMMILQGMPGKGKSSFGKILFGKQFFRSGLPKLDTADAAIALQGNHCVEFSELSQFRKIEVEVVREYIVQEVDKVRMPYGRRFIESPRQCVFFGTTNNIQYLLGEKTDRRFCPLIVMKKLDQEKLEKERIQLWAEALYIYRMGLEPQLYLSDELEEYVSSLREERMVEDESDFMLYDIKKFVEKERQKAPSDRFDLSRFSLVRLFEPGIGPLEKHNNNKRSLYFASEALKKLGGIVKKIGGNKYWTLPRNIFEINSENQNELN